MNDEAVSDDAVASSSDQEEELEWPIGFITVLVLAALYLGWRLIQLIVWMIDMIG